MVNLSRKQPEYYALSSHLTDSVQLILNEKKFAKELGFSHFIGKSVHSHL